MGNHNGVTKVAKGVEGDWLKKAIEALGETISEVTRQMGLNHNKRLYQHFNNDSHLGANHLLALKRAYPLINLNYVLAGEEPILIQQPLADLSNLTDDARTVYEVGGRLLKRLEGE